jgi:hypothetical protein
MAGRVAQGIGPEFKPQYHKKKKKLTIAKILKGDGENGISLNYCPVYTFHDSSVIFLT